MRKTKGIHFWTIDKLEKEIKEWMNNQKKSDTNLF